MAVGLFASAVVHSASVWCDLCGRVHGRYYCPTSGSAGHHAKGMAL